MNERPRGVSIEAPTIMSLLDISANVQEFIQALRNLIFNDGTQTVVAANPVTAAKLIEAILSKLETHPDFITDAEILSFLSPAPPLVSDPTLEAWRFSAASPEILAGLALLTDADRQAIFDLCGPLATRSFGDLTKKPPTENQWDRFTNRMTAMITEPENFADQSMGKVVAILRHKNSDGPA